MGCHEETTGHMAESCTQAFKYSLTWNHQGANRLKLKNYYTGFISGGEGYFRYIVLQY